MTFKSFVSSIWWSIISYALIVIGGLIAVYHLFSTPAVMISVISFVATGFILIGIRYLLTKKVKSSEEE